MKEHEFMKTGNIWSTSKTGTGNVYCYTRWSSDPQSWGDSERRQLQLAEDWCCRFGRTLSKRTFTDRGVSGWRGDNRRSGALGALLKIVVPGDVILIEDWDRWSREAPLDSLNALWDTVKKDVEVAFLKTGVTVNKENFNNPAILFPAFFGSFIANSENEKRAFRIQEAMKARRAQIEAGKPVHGRLPAWLSWPEKADKPVVIEEKAAVVRRIFQLANSGHGVHQIEKLMRETPPISNHPRASWNSRFIHRVLTDKSVLGYHGSVGTKVYPPIVNERDFFIAANKLKARRTLTVTVKHCNNNLFTRLVYCSRCRLPLVRQSSNAGEKRYCYLICRGNLRKQSDCKFYSLRYDKFEASFLCFILQTNLVTRFLSTEDRERSKLEAIKGELIEVQRQCEKYERAFESDPNPSRRLVEKLKLLEAKEAKLMAEVEATERKTKGTTPASIAYARFTAEIARHIHEPEYRAKIREALQEIVGSILVELDRGRYEVWLKEAKMPVTVILGPTGWLISPSPREAVDVTGVLSETTPVKG